MIIDCWFLTAGDCCGQFVAYWAIEIDCWTDTIAGQISLLFTSGYSSTNFGASSMAAFHHEAVWDRVLAGTEIIRPVQHKAVWDRVLAGPRSLDDGERGPLYVTMHYHHQNQSAFTWAAMTCFFEVSTHNVGQRKKVFMTVFIAQQ